MNRIFLFAVGLMAASSVYCQVGINTDNSAPHPSAILDVHATDRGLLPPRLTSGQRDAIQSPSPGLRIYNMDTGCENFFNGVTNQWMELCGACTPQPSVADAGPNQTGVSGTSTNLAAVAPTSGSGSWSIIQGTGGSLSDPSNPGTLFTGTTGSSYTLRWTVQNSCGSSTADITVSFASLSKRVFVSSTTTNGNMGGLSGADLICQNRANAAGLGGTWKAWLSSTSLSAASRLNQSTQPYTLVNGTIIANNWADLTNGSIANPINRTEFGAVTTNGAVWTHTTTTGASSTTSTSQNCNNWTASTTGNTLIHCAGSPFQTNGDWTAGYSGCAYPCNSQFPLFCFEQ